MGWLNGSRPARRAGFHHAQWLCPPASCHGVLWQCPPTPHHAMSVSPDTTQCHGVPIQAISSSPFTLQVGQLPILTQLLQCHNDIPTSRFPPGCRGCFRGNIFPSLLELLCEGRREPCKGTSAARSRSASFSRGAISAEGKLNIGGDEAFSRQYPWPMISEQRRIPAERGVIVLQTLISAVWQYLGMKLYSCRRRQTLLSGGAVTREIAPENISQVP